VAGYVACLFLSPSAVPSAASQVEVKTNGKKLNGVEAEDVVVIESREPSVSIYSYIHISDD
jgi:hypothetical protein